MYVLGTEVATAKTQTSAPPGVYSGVSGHKGQYVVGELFTGILVARLFSRMALKFCEIYGQ